MKNILGQDLEAAERSPPRTVPGVYVHLYGKTESRPKRKMGHITFVGMDAARFEAEWADVCEIPSGRPAGSSLRGALTYTAKDVITAY